MPEFEQMYQVLHLQQLKSRFPGTLLTGKIYLNENHLNKQNGTNGNENYKSS